MQNDFQDSRSLPATHKTTGETKKVIPNPLNAKLLEAIKAREEELKNDPNARYVDAHNVWCLLCDRNIKLSTKSLFDLSHWREHRLKKHGIRHSSVSSVKKPHTTRLLVQETKEGMRLRKSTVTADKKSTLQTQLTITQPQKFPSPSSSDTSSQSSRDGPRRSARFPKPSQRFSPLTTVPNNVRRSSSRRHPSSTQGPTRTVAISALSRHSRSGDRETLSPLSSAPRSSTSSTSSLTSLSSLSSIGEDPINPPPLLPDLKLPSEIQDYLRFARWPPQIGSTGAPETDYPSGGPFPCWKDWSWSMLILPRWSTSELESDGEDGECNPEPLGTLRIPRDVDDVKRLAAVPECTMDENDPRLTSSGVGYMFFDQDASEAQPVTF